MRLQFVGGGKMAEALIGGLVASGWANAKDLHVVEPDPQRQTHLINQHPDLSIDTKLKPKTDAVVAVKPNVVDEVLPALARSNPQRVLSIAAGVSTKKFEASLPHSTAVVRAMPNTPALVGKGAAAIARGKAATQADLDWATQILEAVGEVVVVDEADLDAVTGLSGSGPAYVFFLAEALIAAGVEQGLAPEVADTLTRQTLLGAATLLTETGEAPEALRQDVTSPGGTTAAGLASLGEADFKEIVAQAVEAATHRSRQLGR